MPNDTKWIIKYPCTCCNRPGYEFVEDKLYQEEIEVEGFLCNQYAFIYQCKFCGNMFYELALIVVDGGD